MFCEIYCLNTGYNNFNQALVEIYDDDNNLIFCDNTRNGRVSIFLKNNCYYKIYAKLSGVTKFIYTKPCKVITVSFCNNIILYNYISTFNLTDYYYNMPIEEGTIILCQKQSL